MKTVTVSTIAEHVGLSKATVSAVLANRHVERRLPQKTVDRVQAAARELGYVPNLAGRRLRGNTGRTREIELAIISSYEASLLLVAHVLQTFQSKVEEVVIENTHFSVAVEMFHARRLREVRGLLDPTRFNGVLIVNTVPEDDAFLASVKLPYAAVVLGRRIPGYNCVLETPGVVGRSSASILISVGARKLAVLYGKELTQTTQDRLDSFVGELTSRTGQPPQRIECEVLSAGGGYAAMKKFFAAGGTCDGLFTVTDSLAQGAYAAIREQGLVVGEDIAVVGLGDGVAPEFMDPPLTATHGDITVVESEAVGLLLKLLKGEKSGASEICVTPLPIIRESSRLKKKGL